MSGSAVEFQTEPARYRHWQLSVEGRVAQLTMQVSEDQALGSGIALKLNSYDLGVDIELRDAVRRLRFEHPEVCCVVIESGRPEIFCAGANIQTLSVASHAEKVNFCKYTNETRFLIEDSSRSGQTYLAALAGTASGGGYELALACERILMVDDRKSAISLPEVALLGVLPGTGGLTRLGDKRHVRRDLADRLCTLEEGVRAPRALEWGLVDAIALPSRFGQLVRQEVDAIVAAASPPPDSEAVPLEPLQPERSPRGLRHRHVSIEVDPERRCAEIEVRAPEAGTPRDALLQGLALARELEDVLLRLRFHWPEAGLWLLRTRGDPENVRALDLALAGDEWLARAVRDLLRQVLKQLDLSARTVFARIEPGSCFCGTLLELALATDQSFMRDSGDDCAIELTPANLGFYPTASGWTRLEVRFAGNAEALSKARSAQGPIDPGRALELGLVTAAPDEIDYEDELRVAIEERASFSPDALTGLEANLRFPGPETLETKIFGRLSAWQNWVFQRPNASGPDGALAAYGRPERAKFSWTRT